MNEMLKAPNRLDRYQLLEKQKKELFEDITQSSDLSQADRDYILARVFEHSFEDGIDLSSVWVSDKSVVMESVISDDFISKHPELSLRLANKLQEYRDFVDAENKPVMEEFSDIMLEKVGKSQKGDLTQKYSKLHLSTTTDSLVERLDDYYLNFIRLTKVKEQDSDFQTQTKAEKLAEQTMLADLRILEPHFYSAQIQKLVGDEIQIKPGILNQDEVDDILTKAKLSPVDEKVKQVMKKARYAPLDVTYNIQHKESEKLLKVELIDNLQRRGYSEDDFELGKNEKTKKFEVIDKTGGNHEFKAENLRLVDEYSDYFKMGPEDPYYESLKAEMEPYRIDQATGRLSLDVKSYLREGEIYKVIRNKIYDGNLGFIIYPDGNRSELSYDYDVLSKTKRGLYYLSRADPGGSKNKMYRDGKLIQEHDDYEYSGRSTFIEGEDESTYLLGYQFDYDTQRGRHAIFKDQQIIKSAKWDEFIQNLSFVDGKLTYTKLPKGRTGQIILMCGEQEFGPYKSIRVLKGDKLSFVAELESGEKILYQNNEEHPITIEGSIEQATQTSDGMFMLVSRVVEKGKEPYLDKKEYYVVDKNGDEIVKANEIKNFGTYGGKLAYMYSIFGKDDVSEKKWQFVFGDDEKEIDGYDGTVMRERRLAPEIVGEFGDDLVYKTKSTIGTFKTGDIDISKVIGVDIENIEELKVEDVQIHEGHIVIIFDVEYKKSVSEDSYKVYKYTPEFTLTEKEKKKLELLNLLESYSPEQIREYFAKEYPDESQKSLIEKVKESLEHSKVFAKNVGQVIAESPALFLDSISAKKDDLSDRNIDEFISSVFPEVQTNHKRDVRKAMEERRYNSSNVAGYLGGGRETDGFSDGDPSAEAELEILTLRQPVSEFIATGIYGAVGKGSSSWKKVPFQLSENHIGPTRDVTAEIKVTKNMRNIVLPKCLNAYIIPERVKGVLEDGTEINIEISKNSLGEVSIQIPEGVTKVLYSQAIQELPVIPSEIDNKQYKNFRDDIEKRFGVETVAPITRLPEELSIFIESIADLEPLEKIEIIESFVRDIGYYDFDNKEVQHLKKYKSTEEVIAVMTQRMKEIKRLPKTPDKEKLEHKKYAGVCSDFAKLTTALLREAGIVSGMVSGFQTDGTETVVTEQNAHGISYALFPVENGKSKIIEIDGTPHGLNDADEALLERIRQLSLKERRKKFEDEKEKSQEHFEKKMKEFEDFVSKLNDDAIKKLQNGELEKFLNAILSGVKESHVAVIDRVLNASRYAGFSMEKIIKTGDMDSQIKFMQLLEREIGVERQDEKSENYFKGEKLFKTIEEFVVRYSRDDSVGDKGEALKIIEKIFDMSKKHLDPLEYRSAIAIVTYLKASKMS